MMLPTGLHEVGEDAVKKVSVGAPALPLAPETSQVQQGTTIQI